MAKRTPNIVAQVEGERLKTARIRAGLTQSEAAEKIHMTRGYIWNLENSNVNPSSNVLASLCHFYGCSIDSVTAAKAA